MYVYVYTTYTHTRAYTYAYVCICMHLYAIMILNVLGLKTKHISSTQTLTAPYSSSEDPKRLSKKTKDENITET